MNTKTIRQELQNYLEIADEKKVKEIYAMMESEIKEANIEFSDELKKSLDSQYESYKNGTARMISSADSKKRINKILGK